MRVIDNQHGVALVTTLAVVAILLTAAIQVARLAGESAMRTTSENKTFQARQQAMAGIHLGMAILSKDAADNDSDSLQEIWADPEKISEIAAQIGFKQEQVTISIEDEMGKMQLNALLKDYPGNAINTDQREMLERFFTLADKDAENEENIDAAGIVNAVKDWLDSNDNDAITGLSGAESAYYESLDTPYQCSNGPFNRLGELFNVKGIEKNILEQGIEKYFTVYGLDDSKDNKGRFTFPGRININTAPIEVLEAVMPEGRDHLALDLVDFRIEKASEKERFSNLLEPGWFERIIEFSNEEKTAFKRKIMYSSHLYKITCQVKANNSSVKLFAVVKRVKQKTGGEWSCRILQLEQG